MRFKTDPEAMILGVLAEGPLHGYGIVKAIQEASDGLFKMAEGQLYPVLHGMQKRGWIQGEWETSESGPARKAYRLLEAGRLELEARRADWQRFAKAAGNVLFTLRPEANHG
ncbi:MAG TPA: helix-turn-helix transcriptional regulator [Fimbriimonadaceae bacterium]|nr:helix-turn-helix transcriptional regulator [Fimbriimonadaceae bacterium]